MVFSRNGHFLEIIRGVDTCHIVHFLSFTKFKKVWKFHTSQLVGIVFSPPSYINRSLCSAAVCQKVLSFLKAILYSIKRLSIATRRLNKKFQQTIAKAAIFYHESKILLGEPDTNLFSCPSQEYILVVVFVLPFVKVMNFVQNKEAKEEFLLDSITSTRSL